MVTALCRWFPQSPHQHFLAPVLILYPVRVIKCHLCQRTVDYREPDPIGRHAADCVLRPSVLSARAAKGKDS